MRLIEADAVLACFHEWVDQYGDAHTPDEMPEYRRIEDLPTVDAVEVVRCAVCIHFQYNMRGDGTLPNGVDEFECRNGRGGCDPMGFCDDGERKDGGNGSID